MNGFTVRQKLFAAFGLIVVIIAVVVFMAVGGFNRLGAAKEATGRSYGDIVKTGV